MKNYVDLGGCYPPVVGVEAKRFATCCPLAIGSETFRFLLPIGYWKRNVSLLVAHWLLEARRFASCCPLAIGSETFRFFLPIGIWKGDVSLLSAQ